MARFSVHKKIFLAFAFILNIVNLITNWLLYRDIIILKPGLVFGPYSMIFNHTVLGLCILSTLINFLEVASLYGELFKKDSCCWLSGQTTSALSIWLDDIPKAGIMLYIAACHDMAISVEEVVRAILLLVTIIVRSIAYSVRETCVRRRQKQGLPTREEIMYRRKSCRGCHFGFICLGLLFKLIAFITIYMLTFFTVYPGGLTYKIPSGLLKPKRDVSRFVHNSSIFAGIHVNKNGLRWVELTPISSIVEAKDCSSILQLKENSTIVRTRCEGSTTLHPIISPAITGNFSIPSEVNFHFKYIDPTKSLLLGNIQYTVDASEDFRLNNIKLKYFCVNISPQNKLNEAEYSRDSDGNKYIPVISGRNWYVPVNYCWKTGKSKCKMTGMDGPLFVQSNTQ